MTRLKPAVKTWRTDPITRQLILTVTATIDGHQLAASAMVEDSLSSYRMTPPVHYIERDLQRKLMAHIEEELFPR